MTTVHPVAHSSVDNEAYEPYNGFDAVLEGDPAAAVAWLRTTSAGEGVLYAGTFVVQPSRFRYTFAADESLHVLDGDVEIEIDGGPTVRLRAGDIASFPKGARSTWTVVAALKKFFVISG
jgi:uncharacterized cupin superfamily protein